LETGKEHAHLIRTVLQAGKKYREVNGITYRTVSIASDGEAKRGGALVEITMRWALRSTSPIYHQLKPLTFLNLLVGEDDITADKDFKHIFKRQRNLILRNKGFVIEGFCITPQKAPVVWSYSLDAHFRDRHKLIPAYFPIKIQLSASETEGMKTIWDHKYQLRKKRNLKGKKNPPLNISASHSYGLPERSVYACLLERQLIPELHHHRTNSAVGNVGELGTEEPSANDENENEKPWGESDNSPSEENNVESDLEVSRKFGERSKVIYSDSESENRLEYNEMAIYRRPLSEPNL
jgi:hypothetical protein